MDKIKFHNAFSLVEVVLALGVITFGILTVIALIPIGLKENAVSTNETIAISLLTQIEADLRTSPPDQSGSDVSVISALSPLPYELDVPTSQVYPNSGISIGLAPARLSDLASSGSTVMTRYFSRDLTAATNANSALYRVTLHYTRAPGLGSAISNSAPDFPDESTPVPVEAHLMISWPAILDPLSDTDRSNMQGLVESYLVFPTR